MTNFPPRRRPRARLRRHVALAALVALLGAGSPALAGPADVAGVRGPAPAAVRSDARGAAAARPGAPG
ncbi:hypothetical protein K7B10_08660, partial [Streptomyces flavotricini]|nr:hypothetical protein [Streptomyces flavotricini]